MTPPALPLGEERYTPTDGAEIVSGDQAPRGLDPARHAMEVGAWRFLLPLAAT